MRAREHQKKCVAEIMNAPVPVPVSGSSGGSGRWWWAGLAALAAGAAWVWLTPPDELAKLKARLANARSAVMRTDMHPRFKTEVLDEFVGLGEDQVRRAREHLTAFSREYQATYEYDRCTAAQVRVLFDHSARAMRALNELAMRLPNDYGSEARLRAFSEASEKTMTAHVEDVKARCRVGLHVAPLDYAHTGAHATIRAVNDILH